MKKRRNSPLLRVLPIGLLAGFILLGAGCKKTPGATGNESAQAPASGVQSQSAPDDQQISSQVQAKIAAEPALDGQPIEVNVANGIVTLSGTATNAASRALAAADSGSVAGVRTVINNMIVAPAPAPVKAQAKAAAPPERRHDSERALRSKHNAAREAIAQATPPPPPPPPSPAPAAPEAVKIVPPPPPPPPPVVKTVTLAAGTIIPVRMTDLLESGSTQQGTVFHASLAADLIEDGMVAAPRGSDVVGRVIVAKDATHFSGSSELSIELTKIIVRGQDISLVTDTYDKKGAGRGKNTALKSGGGAALGAIIGALAGGGKGAAIGAVAGGGAGAGVNGVSRGKQVEIPSESLVNFKLQSPISVTTSRVAGSSLRPDYNGRPQLQQP